MFANQEVDNIKKLYYVRLLLVHRICWRLFTCLLFIHRIFYNNVYNFVYSFVYHFVYNFIYLVESEEATDEETIGESRKEQDDFGASKVFRM